MSPHVEQIEQYKWRVVFTTGLQETNHEVTPCVVTVSLNSSSQKYTADHEGENRKRATRAVMVFSDRDIRCSGCQESMSAHRFSWNHRIGRIDEFCNSCYGLAFEVSRRSRAKSAKYKIKSDEYLQLLKAQKSACAICREFRPPQWLVVDHCHTTVKVSGLLCTNCNVGLGQFEDDAERLRVAAAYIERHGRKPAPRRSGNTFRRKEKTYPGSVDVD